MFLITDSNRGFRKGTERKIKERKLPKKCTKALHTKGPTAPCWGSSLSVWSTALSFLALSWTWELKIAQVLCLPYLKHACLKAHLQLKFSVWPDYQSSGNVEERHFQTDRLEKVTDSTSFFLSFWRLCLSKDRQWVRTRWPSGGAWVTSWERAKLGPGSFPPSEWQAGEQLEESTFSELYNFI